jgi:hypothetical protein
MAGRVEQSIIAILGERYPQSFTIRQVAERLGKAYPHVHAVVTALLEEGVLHKDVVGNAYACRLDFASERTRALYAILTLDRARAAIAKGTVPREAVRLAQEVEREPGIRAGWWDGKRLVALVRQGAQAPRGRAGAVYIADDKVPSDLFSCGNVILFGAMQLIDALMPSAVARTGSSSEARP